MRPPVSEAPPVWVAQINRIEGAQIEVERAGQVNNTLSCRKERMMDKKNEGKLWRLFKDNINDMLALADAMGIEHPYWTEQTAELMADAVIAIVKACELPKEEAELPRPHSAE